MYFCYVVFAISAALNTARYRMDIVEFVIVGAITSHLQKNF